MTEYLLLAVAAFFAGMLNTVAGGGTFLTFPPSSTRRAADSGQCD
ncbi:hypothetical protein [Tianweitania sediminis]|nr:hypothetical protein [Tianweitania sediminis]